MTTQVFIDWHSLPDLIFDDIMLMIDFESLEKCRQVCKTWNKKIMRNLWENPRKQWGNIIERRIEKQWFYYAPNGVWRMLNFPTDEKIAHVVLLGKAKNDTDCVIFLICIYIFFSE